jgi:hypothetical protein
MKDTRNLVGSGGALPPFPTTRKSAVSATFIRLGIYCGHRWLRLQCPLSGVKQTSPCPLYVR